MRRLQNFPRVTGPDSDFPYGRVKDTTPTERGTPVNELTHGDRHQFFEKLMDVAGITANEVPDCEYTGFQLFQAFLKVSNKYNAKQLVQSLMGVSYTDGDLMVLFGVKITLSGGNNTANWTAGAILYNDAIYLVSASTGGGITKPGGDVFLFIIDDEDDQIMTIDYGDSGSGIADYNASEVVYIKKEVPTNTSMTAFSVSNCSFGNARINAIVNGDIINFSLEVSFTVTTGASDTTVILNKISGLDLYPTSFSNFPIAGIFKLKNLSSPADINEQIITNGLNGTDISIDSNGRINVRLDDTIVGDGVTVGFLVNGTMKRTF